VGLTWRQFLSDLAQGILACDCFHVDTVLFQRLSGVFVLELATRRVHILGVTANLTGAWVAQQARNLLMDLADRTGRFKFLIRDRDTKFTVTFDVVFASEGIRILRTPVRAPRANAVAERWVGAVRREVLDRMLLVSRRYLEQTVSDYVAHYNEHRPHRFLGQAPPLGAAPSPLQPPAHGSDGSIDSVDSSTSTPRSHEVDEFSAPTGSAACANAFRRHPSLVCLLDKRRPFASSAALAVQVLEQLVSGELDLLVTPLGRPVVTGNDARPMEPTKVTVDERVACLGLVRCPVRQPEMPFGVLVPGM
jgi:hypothetical protein